MKKLSYLVMLTLFVSLIVTGCTGAAAPVQKGPLNVSAKGDTEGSLLQQIIVQTLNKNGFQANEKPRIVGTQLIRQALITGEVDIYPEYTGNGAFFFSETGSDVWSDAQKGYERVKQLDKLNNNIVWLQPAPANNTWAIAIPRALAEKENLRSLVDLAAYVNRGGAVKLAGSQEFITSPMALPAFEKAYSFTIKNEQLVSLAGGNTALTEKAAAEGTDGVNAAMAYGTDGALSALGLVVLTDPLGVQPVYEPAPVVRGAIYAQYPELSTILDPVFSTLTLETLQSLNAKIAIEGQDPAVVARDYLTSKNF